MPTGEGGGVTFPIETEFSFTSSLSSVLSELELDAIDDLKVEKSSKTLNLTVAYSVENSLRDMEVMLFYFLINAT